jgi:hypothetical protein
LKVGVDIDNLIVLQILEKQALELPKFTFVLAIDMVVVTRFALTQK